MFKFQLLSDTDSESGILFAKQQITSNGFNKYITSENYGSDLNGVVIILVCRKPEIILKNDCGCQKKKKYYIWILCWIMTYLIIWNSSKESLKFVKPF